MPVPKQIEARVSHANSLLSIIGSYGRHFFASKSGDVFGTFEVDSKLQVWYVDARTSSRILTTGEGADSRWHGFSHGGTLKDIIKLIRDYILTGRKLDEYWIGCARSDGSNAWGYGVEPLKKLRARLQDHPAVCFDQMSIAL